MTQFKPGDIVEWVANKEGWDVPSHDRMGSIGVVVSDNEFSDMTNINWIVAREGTVNGGWFKSHFRKIGEVEPQWSEL